MLFWIFMLICDLIIPFTMIFFGWRFIKHPPKEINTVHGYKTRRSSINQDTWAFAQNYCGKIWYWSGLILIPVTIVAMLFFINSSIGTVGITGGIICGIQVIPMLGVILPTEIALKKTFDENGNRNHI